MEKRKIEVKENVEFTFNSNINTWKAGDRYEIEGGLYVWLKEKLGDKIMEAGEEVVKKEEEKAVEAPKKVVAKKPVTRKR